jgi:hypothetical protein
MSPSRRAFLAALAAGAGSLLGCNKQPQGMPGMEPGTGPPTKKDLPLRSGKKKPMPAEPPPPKAPP